MSRHTYREGDQVRIVNSRFIKRIGYPIAPNDLRDEMVCNDRFLGAIKVLGYDQMPKGSRAYQKLLDAVCFAEISRRGFGGRERAIHYMSTVAPMEIYDGETCCPDHAGRVTEILRKYTRNTGTHFSASGGRDDWSGEYWYEPGGLTDMRVHIILETSLGKIEACDVEPVA